MGKYVNKVRPVKLKSGQKSKTITGVLINRNGAPIKEHKWYLDRTYRK